MWSKTNDKALFTIFCVVLVDLLGFGIILPLLPYIAEQYQANPLQIGILAATYSFFQFLAGPVLGRLSDHYGRKRLLVASQVGSVGGYILLAVANSLPLLFVSRIIDGLTGGNISIAQAYVADITTKENRAKAMGMIGAAFGIGFMLGPAIGGYLAQYGFYVPALLAAGFGLITTVMTATLLQETVNTRQAQRSPRTAFSWRELGRAVTQYPLGLLSVVYLLVNLGFSGLQGSYALFAQAKFGWGASEVGGIFAFIGVMSVIAQLKVLPFFITRFGERLSLKLALPILILGFTLLPISSIEGALALHLLANMLVVLGNSLANPTIVAIASENVKKEAYGGTLGFLQSAAAIGRVGGPVLAGWLYYTISPEAPFMSAALLLAIATIILMIGLDRPNRLWARLFGTT